jgi:hypothetical protein
MLPCGGSADEEGCVRFLCLAYGDGEDWAELSDREQQELLAQDARLLERGDMVAAVDPEGMVVRAWGGKVELGAAPFARGDAPLAGFAIVEADTLEDAIALVKDTPCARAKGAIELRRIME